MSILFRREFYNKAVSLLLTLAFLVESTLAPILLFLPQTASAAGSWGISNSATYPSPVIRGKSVDFVTTLTVTSPPSPLNFRLEVSKDLALRHYYMTRTGEQETALGDPTRPAATLANRNAYVWDFYNLTTGTYTLRFNFDVPLSTADASAQFDILMSGLSNGFGSGYQDQSFPTPLASFSSDITGGAHVPQGSPLAILFTGAAPSAPVYVNCIDPNGVMCADNLVDGATTASGQWSKNYDTKDWTLGTYRGWIVVNGVKSNLLVFTVTAPATAQTIVISRTPSTSPTSPFKVGDATISSSVNTPSLFASNLTGTGYNRIEGGPTRTFSFTTADLVSSGACNAQTGACNIPGNWSVTDFLCPAGVTGTKKMTEWYTIGGITSNELNWYFECSGTTSTTNAQTPVGSLDGIDTNGNASGWAADPDSKPTAISVHFYIDGAAGQGGTYAGSAVANLANANANNSGYPGNHGYTFSIPSQWRDGKPHTLYVHGIDLSGDGSKNVLLSNVPKSFTLGTVTTAQTITISRTPTTSQAAPYKVDDATISSSVNTPSLFASNLTGTGYNRIEGGPTRTFSFTTADLVSSGACNAQTGACNIPGNWSVTDFLCPAGVTGTKKMTEWYTIGGITSNELNWYFECSGTTSTTNAQTPVGSLDGIDTNGNASGWAADPDSKPTAISVHFYVDGAAGQGGTYAGSVVANIANAAANTAGYSGNHGYNFSIPSQWRDGKPHTLYVHGIDLSGDGSKNVLLSNMPKSFTLGTVTTPPSDRPAPTPTTAPMATLTFERDQEQVLPNQPASFSGTLDASKVAFPQGSSLFIAIPEKTSIERIEIDGRTLGTGEFALSGGSAKIPFPQNLYNGSHSFHIVLRNEVSAVPQLDRNIAVWVSVVDATSKLLLKGRTASTMVAHLPTEVIGMGVSLAVPPMFAYNGRFSGIPCCWASADPTHFPIREFKFGEMDITRGPFFTPNHVPLLPDNIAFTLFPGDASMQRIGLSLKQFSDPLAREFITAQYQYLLGRDPSSEELSRHLPAFAQWRNPLANLMEVYNRRADVRQAVMVPRDKNIGGNNSGSPLPSYDKLLEWAATKGWSEEPSLASFKLQTGFDNGWQSFQELWVKYAPLVGLGDPYLQNYSDYLEADSQKNPVSAIARMCNTSNLNHKHYTSDGRIDFEFCWKNDPMVRHTAILWAKDSGWAYNQFVQYIDNAPGTGTLSDPVVVTINPSGPILASMFAPGKYSEYVAEQQWRYPPAQMYYDLISSSEYASSVQQRFRTNIDSIYRLFFSRPAIESDIAWVKNKFIGGIASYEFSDSKIFGFDRRWSWINEQWEPNGGLIASNFEYVEDAEFLKNSRFITDDIYGIRYIPGEIDAVSSRLLEVIERKGKQELYQGDNFKRIVTGLYRLYLRRNPTDAEIELRRASGKGFGDIEFKLNQSSEYGDDPASPEAIRNLYRNYLGRDPNDADIASWGSKTISSIANKIGTSAEMRSLAQSHQENAYIFPIKEINLKSCGFFCSIFGKIVGFALNFVPVVGPLLSAVYTVGTTIGTQGANYTGAKSAGSLLSIALNSISRSFNEAGFNGKTFVSYVSIARAMAGQAGGVFSMTNLLENADPTILDGFRTMAVAPQTPQGNAFAQAVQQAYPGLASPLAAVAGLFGAKQEVSTGRLAQVDVSGHYGLGANTQVSGAVAPAGKKSNAKTPTPTKVTAPVSFTKMLSQGSRGAEVLKLQKVLGGADLTFLPEYQTGYYGAKTVAAVKRFQKRYGLEQVGFVGSKTRALLNSAR